MFRVDHDPIEHMIVSLTTHVSRESQIAYRIFYFAALYVLLLILFIFCYWRILIVIRR